MVFILRVRSHSCQRLLWVLMNSKSFMKPVLLTGFRLPVFHALCSVLVSHWEQSYVSHATQFLLMFLTWFIVLKMNFMRTRYGLTWRRVSESESCLVVSDSLQPHGLYSQWNLLDQNTGVGRLSLLQRIFPIQGSNPGLPHSRWILCQPSHKGSPKTLEWVAYPFCSGSSWPRNWTRVSCWAIREAWGRVSGREN